MNSKMLKKDLMRKKSMNLILLTFIFLAAMFIASSVNNMLVATTGVDYFFKQSQIKDYFMFTMGEIKGQETENDKKFEAFLEERKEVKDYTKDDCIYIGKSNIEIEDKEIELNSSVMMNCYDIKQQKFFDENDKEIKSVSDEEIYLSMKFVADNNLKKGDTIKITAENGYEKEYKIAGICKDALLGSDLMGMTRFIISDANLKKLMNDSELPCGKLYSIELSSPKEFDKAFNNEDFTSLFSCNKSLIQMSYVMDMVVAAVLLLISACLIIISIVILRFIIVFTVNEDYKEIGIMKAIGIPDRGIRKLYITKYLVISSVGSLLGFAASIPFGNALLKSVIENIVVQKGGENIWLQFIICISIVIIITAFAYISTAKIKKMSPMDAIRSGANGERFSKKTVLRLANWKMKPTSYLAVNDIISEWRKYVILLITGIVGTWLIVMPINTINTLSSDEIASTFSVLKSDLVIVDDTKVNEFIVNGKKQEITKYLNEVKNKLQEKDIPVKRVFMEIMFRLRVRKGENSVKSISNYGFNTKSVEYVYDEGSAPLYENEVALAYVTAETIEAKIGDTVYITIDGEEKAFIVTGLYQSMNNMGQGIRFNENMEMNYSIISGTFGTQIELNEKVDAKQLQEYLETIEKIYPETQVKTLKQFISNMLGGTIDKIEGVKILILGLVIIINILVVVLMQKMFFIRERGEMGMLKSIGFSNTAIAGWQTKRIAIVLFIGILIGTITGTPFSQVTSGQVFKMMGAKQIQFVVEPLEVYAIYPAIVFIFTLAACIITMHKIKKISVKELNNIE